MSQIQTRWVLFCWLVLLMGPAAKGQQLKDAERHYRSGIRLVQQGDYERGRNELLPVMQRGGSYAPFAYYYHADASFRQKRFAAARLTLKELIDRFPNWQKKEEAYYLAAASAYEQGLYDEGLSYTQLVGSPELRPDVDRMERIFLPRITDLNRLKGLQRQYTQNKVLAQALVDLIQRTSSDRNDLELSDRLSNRYGVLPTPAARPQPAPTTTADMMSRTATGTVTAAASPRPDRSRAKGYYNVGVLFPFRLSRFSSADRQRANQYAYDLYEGMKLAKSKLMTEGITVNLFAYDLENDADQTLDILNNPSFGQNDLLIGPLYTEPNRLVMAYAAQNNIPLVNPIATNRDLITDQPNAYLAQPSTTVQALATLNFMKETAENRKAAVYFGAARKDSLLAVTYQTVLKSQGFQVVDFRRLSGKSTTMVPLMRLTEASRPGHVFFASSNNDDGPSLLEALTKKGVSSPLVATSTAFDFLRNSLSTFTRRDLYLVAPEFIDPERSATEAFQEAYLTRRNIIPSTFAAQGYDLLLFFGRQLAKGAFRSRAFIQSDDSDDYVLSGFDYAQSNDNQSVPIIKFDGDRFIKVN